MIDSSGKNSPTPVVRLILQGKGREHKVVPLRNTAFESDLKRQ